MAAIREGRQVLFGISSSVKTVSDSQVAGIVQSASVSKAGNETEIQDEDGDHVAVVYHGRKNEISIELITTESPLDLPDHGDEISFGAVTEIDGVDVSTGRAFISSSSSSQASASTTSVSLTISHYPLMLADA